MSNPALQPTAASDQAGVVLAVGVGGPSDGEGEQKSG